MIRQLLGDCRVTLPMLDAGSVQAVITSPPYYGLRDYGTEPLVWGGEPEHAHEWGLTRMRLMNKSGGDGKQYTNVGSNDFVAAESFCVCGAWLGSHGLEPTPELYIQHEVEIFREVWRVLRNDGVLWLNLGDSYAGSGKGPSNSVQCDASQIGPSAIKSKQSSNAGDGTGVRTRNNGQIGKGQAPTTTLSVPAGLKPKDLMMMPFRVAMALQADGWWLRSVIPWVKRNSMPESVNDRPATSVEYVFLLAKSARYFWDAEAVRARASETTHSRGLGDGGPKMREKAATLGMHKGWADGTRSVLSSRNRRNSDWFFESWQSLMLDEDGNPFALIVNAAPFKGSHFATFPAKLVEPMIKASTREGDTVLDPFGGAGTVGLVADRLGRNAILCELKPDYAAMAHERVMSDAPLFVEVDGGEGEISPAQPDKQAALGIRTYTGFNGRWKADNTPRNDGTRWNENNGRGFKPREAAD